MVEEKILDSVDDRALFAIVPVAGMTSDDKVVLVMADVHDSLMKKAPQMS